MRLFSDSSYGGARYISAFRLALCVPLRDLAPGLAFLPYRLTSVWLAAPLLATAVYVPPTPRRNRVAARSSSTPSRLCRLLCHDLCQCTYQRLLQAIHTFATNCIPPGGGAS